MVSLNNKQAINNPQKPFYLAHEGYFVEIISLAHYKIKSGLSSLNA